MDNNEQNVNTQQNNGVAIAGMVVGIASILFPFYGITGIVGIILSILGLKKTKTTGKGKGMAIAGICCSVVGIVMGIISIIAVIAAFSIITENADELVNSMETINSLYNY